MIEKGTPSWCELNPSRVAGEQLCADLQFKVPQLAAQRRLGGVQPLFGGHGEAAFLGDGDELAKVAKFHTVMLARYCSWTHKVFFPPPVKAYIRSIETRNGKQA